MLSKNDSKTVEETFTKIYKLNYWDNQETVSGSGSTLQQTKVIRTIIPKLIKEFNIKSILDAACGDCNWISKMDISCNYIGIDIVNDIIKLNLQKFANNPNFIFKQLDLITDALPQVDLIICRDTFIHLPNDCILKALKNFKKSGSTFLLTTIYPHEDTVNNDINLGSWRYINLCSSPFNLPCPLLIINEQATDIGGLNKNKSLAVWRLSDINLDAPAL